MPRLLMVGDTHGNFNFMRHMVDVACDNEIDTIVQLGDFGFVWPGSDFNLQRLNDYAATFGKRIVFIPGNHEDWDVLDNYKESATASNTLTVNGFIPIASNIFYTGKVSSWMWDGVRFAVAGGAYSVDKQYRTPGKSWWPQETLTDEDMLEVEEIALPDVLLTHDGPTWAPYGRLMDDIESHIHRQRIDAVYQATAPLVWFHGHYHRYMEYTGYHNVSGESTDIYGLDCDGAPGINRVIFDTETLSVEKGV